MTVRDSITRTRARTPRVEDDPTSATMRDRALGPTQCGISDVATKCTKGGRKPNICRCMLGAVLSWRCLGRHRLRCQPCSRIGENPPYGMIGGIEETSASSKPDPRLDPTRRRGACHETHVPTATGVDGPLAASTCQAGVLANHQEQGAIHERDYDNRPGSSQACFSGSRD